MRPAEPMAGRAHGRASRGDREELPESGETPDPQTSAHLGVLCGEKVINGGGRTAVRWLGANAAPEPSLIRLPNRFRHLLRRILCNISGGDITQRCSRNRGFLRLIPSFTFFLTIGAILV